MFGRKKQIIDTIPDQCAYCPCPVTGYVRWPDRDATDYMCAHDIEFVTSAYREIIQLVDIAEAL